MSSVFHYALGASRTRINFEFNCISFNFCQIKKTGGPTANSGARRKLSPFSPHAPFATSRDRFSSFLPMRAGRVISFLSFLGTLVLLPTASSYLDPNDPSRFDNPISHPQPGDVIQAGSTYNITWTPNRGQIVSIELWTNTSLAGIGNGTNCDVDDYATNCTAPFANISNTGWYLWNVPRNMPSSDEYYFDIYVPDPGPEGPFYYITGNFSVHNDTPPVTTTTAATGAATATLLLSGTGSTEKNGRLL